MPPGTTRHQQPSSFDASSFGSHLRWLALLGIVACGGRTDPPDAKRQIGPAGGAVATPTDANDCGPLGKSCPAGTTCMSGTCQAPPQACGEGAPPSQAAPSGVTLGDWNGDGAIDVATSNYAAATTLVFLGCGNGSFGFKAEYPVGEGPQRIVSCDLSGDGNLDLAVEGLSATTVLLGAGDGTFPSKARYRERVSLVECADLDGDDRDDLIGSSAGTLAIASGTADSGQMRWRHDDTVGLGDASRSLVGDLNEDGKLDLVDADGMRVLSALGNGDGTFSAPLSSPPHGPLYDLHASFALADLNGDGHLDLARGAREGWSGPGGLSMLPGKGDGTFGPVIDYQQRVSICEIATGDLNNDTKTDLIAASGASVAVLLGQSGGGLRRGVDQTFNTPCPFWLADVDGDRKLDILHVTADALPITPLFGIGDGTFREARR
jgi:hypothetical protein